MLLCGIDDVRNGMVLGAAVLDPRSPDHALLRAGVPLDSALLASLKSRGVTQVWVEDDLTRDLDAAVGSQLEASRLGLYTAIREDLGRMSRCTITSGSVQTYRRAVLDMVNQAMSAGPYAGLADSLFASSDRLATHSTNVAYLSLLVGLQLESYVVTEQPRLESEHARDMSVLGLAGLLHDVGKTQTPPSASAAHAAHLAGDDTEEAYIRHAEAGHQMLSAQAHVPARVSNTALNHHQRFDGSGWPDLTRTSRGRITGTLAGRRIHIYSRIVAAANTLDALLRTAEGQRVPPVAALHAFASDRFDGWFDPLVRRALLLRIPPFAVGTDVRLSTGARAVVIAPSPFNPCRPVVRLRTGGNNAQVIDLAADPQVHISHFLGVDVAAFHYDVPQAAVPAPL